MFIDTHIDTLWAMRKENRVFSDKSDQGHVDLSRAQSSGLLCGFFTGFPTESQFITEQMLAEWINMTGEPKNQMTRINNIADLDRLIIERKAETDISKHQIGTLLHFEGAAGIDSSLHRLYIYYDVGLRSMGLTWNETNQFATGQEGDKNRGLTAEGKDLLSAMENLGIMVDISHLNDKSFWEVVYHTTGPIFASHSNVRKHAQHNRNLLDDMVVAVADSDGSIGINLYTSFLETDGNQASIKSAIKMFEEVISLTGVNHVHSGADLDGATLPNDMKDINDIPRLLELVKEDLSLTTNDLEKIKTENVIRVMKKSWK